MSMIDNFADSICSKCLVCQPSADPGICVVHYAGNKDRFWKLLTYILVKKHKDPKFGNKLFTFVGFCGLFCNSKTPCPQYSQKECGKLSTRMDCYDAFVGQCNAVITKSMKVAMYAKFSGIELDLIGKSEYGLLVDDPLLLATPKKKRRKIKELEGVEEELTKQLLVWRGISRIKGRIKSRRRR